MAANKTIPYDGYPQAVGAKLECLGDIWGTANYQAGGYAVTYQQFGFYGRLEFLEFMATQSANYYAVAHFAANTSGANETRAQGAANATVVWFYANNSAEVANNSNLSAEVSQFYARGI